MDRRTLYALALGLTLACLAVPQAQAAGRLEWPTVQAQLDQSRVVPGSALERLIVDNQELDLLNPKELHDGLRIPLWLRVIWRKSHPDDRFSAADATGGYPLVLKEVAEWMLSHQDLVPGAPEPNGPMLKAATMSGETRISGAQTSPRSESDIRVNYLNTQKIIGASNNISSSGRQAMFFSSNGGVSWGQTLLPLVTGDAFMSDPTVDWTSDGTAWSTTIGINSGGTVLNMRSYKSTDGGATWTFDATFSGTLTNNDKQMMWVDHSATSPFKDTIYAIWHAGAPGFVARRTGPTGSWQTPVRVSGAETTGTAIGDDIKTNSSGDVFGFFPDSGSRRLNVVKSTNGGVSFGTPVRIATSFASFEAGIPADASRKILIYMSGGAFRNGTKNNVYASWSDLSGDTGCTSGTGPGTNAASTCKTRVFFSRSTDGGATWSAPVKINNQSGLNDQFNQWLVVDETDGKIALMYYDTVGDSTRKKTNVFYQSSTDDGATWSAPFQVTTATTDETTAGADSGNQYGDYNSLSGIAGTFFPSWTDRRSGASEEIWTAAIADGTTATPDFSISASPSSVSVVQGSAGSSTITTGVSGGFNNAISLSASGVPSGVTVSFSPSSIAAPGSGTSTMNITVGAGAATGTSAITVTGTGGTTTHTTTVSLTVTAAPTPDFSISASPSSVSIAQGAAGSSTITTAVSGGFNNAIALSASGVPSGVTVSFSPSSIAAPGSGTSTMSITVGAGAATGTSTITVTGTGGTTTHTTTVSLTVTAAGGGVTALTNGVPVTGISGALNSQTFFSLAVPAGATNLTFQISGGTGDADLYVRFGAQPTTSTWDCRPFVNGNNETCSFAAPQTGTYFVMLVGFSAYSGVSLVGSFSTGGGGGELITNGGFEGSSSPWTLSGTTTWTNTGSFPHSGTGYVIQAGANNATSTVFQQISIPTGSTAGLTFWLNVTSDETTTTTQFDKLFVEVRNTSGTLLATLATFSNLNKGTAGVYSQKGSFSLSSFAGQTVRIQFRATTDVSLQTTFRVDDVSVH